VIAVGVGAALLGPLVEVTELDAQNGSLERVEAAAVADAGVDVAAAGAVEAVLEQSVSDFLVAGEDHAAVAVGAQILGWIEGEGG
jgi:hypothetical protein